MIAESQIELRRGDVNQIYIKNGQRIPGFAIGIGHTNPGKHLVYMKSYQFASFLNSLLHFGDF